MFLEYYVFYKEIPTFIKIGDQFFNPLPANMENMVSSE